LAGQALQREVSLKKSFAISLRHLALAEENCIGFISIQAFVSTMNRIFFAAKAFID